jgi:hypothetical protein
MTQTIRTMKYYREGTMFVFGLIVALAIFAVGVVGGTLLQSKLGWPWK